MRFVSGWENNPLHVEDPSQQSVSQTVQTEVVAWVQPTTISSRVDEAVPRVQLAHASPPKRAVVDIPSV